ncbi:unnamed protein product, partial [Rotaria magnacalcarata]
RNHVPGMRLTPFTLVCETIRICEEALAVLLSIADGTAVVQD